MAEGTLPVYILTGFLGSGKTTLLKAAVDQLIAQGKRPAVIMNELGEVNLDGVAVGAQVPMAEMLSGCICCTVRGDLSLAVQQLVQNEQPDAIFIEATGVANPMEILDGVTEASLFMKIEVKEVITVVDAAFLLDRLAKGEGKTFRLMQDQIRCATLLLLNKIDLVGDGDLAILEQALREWNPHTRIVKTVRAQLNFDLFGAERRPETGGLEEGLDGPDDGGHKCCQGDHVQGGKHGHKHGEGCGCERENGHGHVHEHADGCGCGHDKHVSGTVDGGHEHDNGPDHGHEHHQHHSHEHVMVYTLYLDKPVDSERFEALVGRLPESVYRAKGVLTFTDTSSRYLFQYAYRQADFMKIDPQANVPDVVVFIGENIPKAELDEAFREL